MALALFLVSAALVLLPPAASAADSPRTVPALNTADRAFIASIAAPRPSTVPVPVAKRPLGDGGGGVGAKALCRAEANCAFGGTVSCEGNNSYASCSAVDGNCSWGNTGYVICDGHYYGCPGSCCPEDFCTRDWQCSQSCYPCNPIYTCDWGSCSDNCDCQWSTCPV
jgi:hypothetical protein